MYIFINADLKMSKGRVSAQVGHIVGKIVEQLVRDGYENFHPTADYIQFMQWRDNPVKIILKATTAELVELMKLDGSHHFIDTNNRFPDNSITCVAFNPGMKHDCFSDFALL
jgi:peptidyl-tRNA hydrolase